MKTLKFLLLIVLFNLSLMSCEPDDIMMPSAEIHQSIECCGEVGQLPDEPEASVFIDFQLEGTKDSLEKTYQAKDCCGEVGQLPDEPEDD